MGAAICGFAAWGIRPLSDPEYGDSSYATEKRVQRDRCRAPIYDTRASWGAPESKNSSDLEFVARASFEVGEIDRPSNVHLIGSHPLVPSP